MTTRQLLETAAGRALLAEWDTLLRELAATADALVIAYREQNERIAAARAETQRIVATGKCPTCGSPLRRNSSITGWWQCEQLGAVTHRARPQDPPCSWQGFV